MRLGNGQKKKRKVNPRPLNESVTVKCAPPPPKQVTLVSVG